MSAAFDRDGYCIIPNVLDPASVERLINALDRGEIERSTRGGDVYGARNLLAMEEIRTFSESAAVSQIVESILGRDARAVRGIFFDKTPAANWPVPWHQDLTLAVAEKHDLEGWHHWSVKGGVVHVQPPVEVLQSMVTLRFQLDDCGADNGPLRVLPGTHRLNLVAQKSISGVRERIEEEVCCASAGSVLMMRPLLLHASSVAMKPKHRRVLHLEFAPDDLLPAPLRWAA